MDEGQSKLERWKVNLKREWLSSISKQVLLYFFLGAASSHVVDVIDFLPEFFKNIFAWLSPPARGNTPSASAAAAGATSYTRDILSFLFSSACLAAFMYSFYKSINEDNKEKRDAAKEHANLFGGVLLGSAKSLIGL